MASDIRGPQHFRWLSSFLCACLWFSQLPVLAEAQTNQSSGNQVREAVRQAVELAHPNANLDQLKMSDRNDLDEELSQIAKKSPRPVSFYSFEGIDSSSDEGALWVVVAGDSPLVSDELYSFESSDGIEQSSQKFNRLLSHLTLSVPDEKAANIAQFFLGCCVRGVPGETITGDDGLRHSVERYYIRIYGDVWRALEAASQWWQGYEKTAAHLKPAVVVQGGLRQITLERLIVSFGMHPQLQRWVVAVSLDGSVRVVTVEPIFPKQSRWLSYAFRSTLQPQIH